MIQFPLSHKKKTPPSQKVANVPLGVVKSFPLFVPLFHGSPAVSVSPLQKPLCMDPIYLSVFPLSSSLNRKKSQFQMSLYKVFYTELPSSSVVFVANLLFVFARLRSIVGIRSPLIAHRC